MLEVNKINIINAKYEANYRTLKKNLIIQKLHKQAKKYKSIQWNKNRALD